MTTKASEARERLAEYLTWEWDLNECEAGDLATFGEVLGTGILRDLYSAYDLDDDGFMAHMEARAELLKLAGSSMQDMYDEFERQGRERRGQAGPEEMPA